MTSKALVTGCQGAIGRAITQQLLEDGLVVVGTDRAADAELHPGPYIPCDLADADSVSAMIEECRPHARDISVLVNNAGIYEYQDFLDVTLADFERTMAVNLTATYRLSQQVSRWIVDAGGSGSIVNIASVNGHLGSLAVPYGTSKAAVIGLTKSMARALAARGVRVNAVAPGLVDTPMNAGVDPQVKTEALSQIALSRPGRPEEIAKVVGFLASPSASYITGSIVDVHGGWPV